MGAGPVWAVARAESRELLRSGRFRWTVATVVVLLLASLISGGQRYAAHRQAAARLAASERERWLGQGHKTPHGAAHHGLFVAKPASALAAFDEGVNAYAGVIAHLEPHDSRLFRFRPAEDMTSLRRLGTLTAATTLQQLLPLVIVLLAHGAFAGERERGTLVLALAAGADRRRLMLGKALGVASPILGALAVACPIGAYVLLRGSAIADLGARALLLGGTYGIFLATVLAGSLLVSWRAPTARAALVALLAAWALACVVAPPMAAEAAHAVSPGADPLALSAAMTAERHGMVLWYERLAAVQQRLLARYGKRTLDELPVSAMGVGLLEEEADQDAIIDRHLGALLQAHARQARLYDWMGLLSPVLALQSLSSALAGTHALDHVDFQRACEAYRKDMVYRLNDDTARNDLLANRTDPGIAGVSEKYYQPGREVWETIPAFHYDPPSIPGVLARHAPAILGIALWAAAIGAMAWRKAFH